MTKVNFEIENCMDCPYHEVLPDPDPYDEFCSDDMQSICKKENRNITVSCRPHHLRKECEIPNWCPLKQE